MQQSVLDLSFSSIPNPGWVERRVAEGVVAIWQDVWTGGYASNDLLRAVAATNLRFIREGGASPCIYANASPWRTPQTWHNESVRNAGTEYQYVKYVMVDIEIAEDRNPIRPELVREFINLFRADGKIVCTYSADWYVGWWKLQLGDVNAVWLGEPYMHARYDGIADLAVRPPVHPLGPLAGKQYLNSHTVEGVSVDTSVMDSSFFEEEDMSYPIPQDEIDRIAKAVHDLMERDTQRTYVRMIGRPEVFELSEDQRLTHAVSGDVFGVQEPSWDVQDLPPEHDIWNLRTEFPGGNPLREFVTP